MKFSSKEKDTRIEKRLDEGEVQRLTLKERHKKVYLFSDFDIQNMLEQLLKTKLIQLPKCKQLEELGKLSYSYYCKNYRVVSYHVEKCCVERIAY